MARLNLESPTRKPDAPLSPSERARKQQPLPFLIVRWLIRLSVISMVVVIGLEVVGRIAPGEGPAVPKEWEVELIRLKGRVAQLELELEEARAALQEARLAQAATDEAGRGSGGEEVGVNDPEESPSQGKREE